jgi:hypothetical protein
MLGQASGRRGRARRGRNLAGARQRLVETTRMIGDEVAIQSIALGEMHQQAAEQRRVGARPDRQMQVGVFRGHGAARIDRHDRGPARLSIGDDPMMQDGMAPGGVRSDQDDQVRHIEVFVAARHEIAAEGAALARDGRGHAEPRVGVDMGRAEEALRQLVGDVIILGQQLAREVEGDRAGAVARQNPRQPARDLVESRAPVGPGVAAVRLAQHRFEQPGIVRERLAECEALRAKPAEIRRMVGIARHHRLSVRARPHQHAAADAAIGAGRADRRLRGERRIHQ